MGRRPAIQGLKIYPWLVFIAYSIIMREVDVVLEIFSSAFCEDSQACSQYKK